MSEDEGTLHSPAGEPVEIVPCPDGPLLVRGPVVIAGASGPGVERGRRTIALCRCGLSTVKPFCDGTHKLTGFRA
jgi:CDGSH-type Zn-finger protein